MKEKNIEWYNDKVQDIKRRKRALRNVEDPKKVKKMKDDLKREQRAAKRGEKNELRNWLKDEINKFKKDE